MCLLVVLVRGQSATPRKFVQGGCVGRELTRGQARSRTINIVLRCIKTGNITGIGDACAGCFPQEVTSHQPSTNAGRLRTASLYRYDAVRSSKLAHRNWPRERGSSPNRVRLARRILKQRANCREELCRVHGLGRIGNFIPSACASPRISAVVVAPEMSMILQCGRELHSFTAASKAVHPASGHQPLRDRMRRP